MIYTYRMYILIVLVFGFNSVRDAFLWRNHTSPLDPSVTQDLCQKLHLPSDDPRCVPWATVYAPEFFETLKETFHPRNGDWANFEEVDAILGDYQFDREPVVKVSNGIEYFRVWYDLKGDRVYPIVVDFYSDGRLWRMIADVGD